MNGVRISRSSLRSLTGGALLACLGILVVWASSVEAEGADRTPFIIGGKAAAQEELPSLVFVVYLIPEKEKAISCTGTVIAPRWVLTAAHCVRPSNVRFGVENFRVVTGSVNWRAPDRRVLDVVRAIGHPRYDPNGGQGDAGLLRLAKPARVPPMPLAGRRFWPNGSEAEIAGWGVLDPGQDHATYLLHRAATTVLGFRECREEGGRTGQICAADAPPHRVSACYGDSGGPLLMRRPGDRRLVEIGVAHGGEYCNPRFPTLYTSTVPIFDWVRARMAEGGRTP